MMIHSAILIKHWLGTNTQTHCHSMYRDSIASNG